MTHVKQRETEPAGVHRVPPVAARDRCRQRGGRTGRGEANALGHNSHGGKPQYGVLPAIPSNVGTIALVQAENHQAYVDNAAHNTLAKALGGGG